MVPLSFNSLKGILWFILREDFDVFIRNKPKVGCQLATKQLRNVTGCTSCKCACWLLWATICLPSARMAPDLILHPSVYGRGPADAVLGARVFAGALGDTRLETTHGTRLVRSQAASQSASLTGLTCWSSVLPRSRWLRKAKWVVSGVQNDEVSKTGWRRCFSLPHWDNRAVKLTHHQSEHVSFEVGAGKRWNWPLPSQPPVIPDLKQP